jgi:general secretion pathway protein E
MVTDDALQRLIHTAADEADLRAHARRHGAHSLRDDGLRLLAEGSTRPKNCSASRGTDAATSACP